MQTAKIISLYILAALALPFCGCGEDAPPGDVVITQQRDGDVIQIFAENVSTKSLAITVQLSNILHAKSEGWPVKATKRCLPGDRVMMTALIQAAGEAAATFTCTVTTAANVTNAANATPAPVPAQPVREYRIPASVVAALVHPPSQSSPAPAPSQAPLQPIDPDFAYRLPYEPGTSHTVSQGYGGVVSHRGAFALDFDMPLGTPVCAARDGTVIELQKDRPDPDSDSVIGNFVAIKHVDGTVALYAQLAQDGVLVTVGQQVRAGDIIAKCGTTGHTNGPHLHFEVDSTKDCIGVTLKGERGSIPVIFVTRQSAHAPLHVGNTYTAD